MSVSSRSKWKKKEFLYLEVVMSIRVQGSDEAVEPLMLVMLSTEASRLARRVDGVGRTFGMSQVVYTLDTRMPCHLRLLRQYF